MGGALERLGVQAVGCGLDLTVALTVDGCLFQMGSTGAPADQRCHWEGARTPTQVLPLQASPAPLLLTDNTFEVKHNIHVRHAASVKLCA